MGLPSLGNSTIGKKVDDFTSNFSPTKIVSDSFDAIKSTLYSEVPEIGTLLDTTSDVVKDVKRSIEDVLRGGRDDDLDEGFEKVVQATNDNTDSVSSVVGAIEMMNNSLAASNNPYLLLINDKMDENNTLLETLAEITQSAWDVSRDQYDITKQMLEHNRKSRRDELFEKQKDEAAPSNDNLPDIIPKEKVKGLSGWVYALLGRLSAGVKTFLAPILAFFGIGAVAGAGGAAAISTAFSKVAKAGTKTVSAFGRIFGIFGKILKGFARVTGIGAVILTVIDGVIGAIKGAVKAFQDGDGVLGIIGGALKGAVIQIVTGISDMLVLGLKLLGVDVKFLSFEKVEEIINNLPTLLYQNFLNFGEMFTQGIKAVMMSIYEGIISFNSYAADAVKPYLEGGWSMIKGAYESFMDGVGWIIDMASMPFTYIKTKYDEVKKWFLDKAESHKKEIQEMNDFILALPRKILSWATDFLPDKVKSFLNLDDASTSSEGVEPTDSTTSSKITEADRQRVDREKLRYEADQELIRLLQSIKDKDIGPERRQEMVDDYKNANSSIYAPTTINNTTHVKNALRTRNQDSPIFATDKVMQ